MAEFTYNNAKNASTGHMPFELNCGYHLQMSYKEKVDLRSKSKSADKLSAKLRELMIVCWENLHHAQELQKRAHDKGVKPRSYAPGDKVWLNSKYIKTKRNRKLEAKFFGPFRVLYPVGKQAYKLELPRKWRIHNVFHVSLLEQDTTKKGWVDKKSDKWNLTQATMKTESMKWRQFATVRSMRESQNQVIYQVSIIWSHEKDIQRKRIPGSQLQRSSTSESSSACSTKTILTIRLGLLLLLTPHQQWLDRQSSRLDLQNKSKDNHLITSTNELKRTVLHLIFIVFLDKFGYLTHSISLAILHVIARDCTWLPADLHQNIYPSTFKSHTWINFFNLVSLSHKASVFFLEIPLGQEVFHQWPSINIFPSIIIDWFLSDFSLQFLVIGLGSFSPATWSFKTHQLPYKAKMLSLVSRFSSPVSQWVERFFIKLHSYLHVWQSSRLRGKAIVMSWSQDL